MKLEAPRNANYAATVFRVGTPVTLAGLDNLDGIPTFGHQALTQKGKAVGDLVIAFTAETALSGEYAAANDLYRESELNADPLAKGYLEKNGRIRAIRLRGHTSNALLMPLSSVEYTGVDWLKFQEGDTFDQLNGHPICEKYIVPVKPTNNPARTKLEKAFKRVTTKQFPEHLDTDNYWRNKHLLEPGREVVVTQKLHGTSIRVGNVPVLRELSRRDRWAKRFGVKVVEHEHAVVFGSRKVIKDFYASDIWTEFGKTIAELIPEGMIVYGELIGWTPDGKPLQKNYTYHLPKGACELYVYRVAHVNRLGNMADLPWDGVKAFCTARGLSWVPELYRTRPEGLEATVDALMNERLADRGGWVDVPLIVSSHKTVDEGVVVRQDGLVPVLLKAKSPLFLEHETKMLDAEVIDIESAEAA